MKQALSQVFDLRSARILNDPNQKLNINNQDKSLSTHRQLLNAVSEKILISNEQSPDVHGQTGGDNEEFKLMSSGKQHTLTRLSNTNTDQQPLNNFLTDDGESDQQNRYDIVLSTDGRNNHILRDNGTVLQTNQTSSSLKNVPMSYSSTGSQGYLNTRFQKLQDLASPDTKIDYSKEESNFFSNDRQPRFQELKPILQSSTKKSVKFIDEQNESRIVRHDEGSGLFSGNRSLLNSHTKDNEIDHSQIIAERIDQRMHEINNKYFSNEKKHEKTSEVKKPKSIIKVLDSSQRKSSFSNERGHLSNTKKEKSQLLDNEDSNSIVAMEDEIEMQKQQFKQKIDNQYFSNPSQEPSIVIQNRQNQPSVFTSTNSFEKLRDEILNHQSYVKESDCGTQNRSLRQILGQEFAYCYDQQRENTMGFTLNNQALNIHDQSLRSELGTETQKLLQNYMPLRRSRDASLEIQNQNQTRNLLENNQHQRESLTYRDYQQKLQNDNQQFESKLQQLKSKINSIHKQGIIDQTNQSVNLSGQPRSESNTIIVTPTMRDLNTLDVNNLLDRQRSVASEQQDPQYTQDMGIHILQPLHEYHTNPSSRSSSQSHNNEQNLNTKDLRSKIMELKQSISDNEPENQVHNYTTNMPLKLNTIRSKSKNFSTIQTKNDLTNQSYRIGIAQTLDLRSNKSQKKHEPINITTFANQTISSQAKSVSQNRSSLKRRQTSLSIGRRNDEKLDDQENVKALKQKIRWLEKRNMEYSQRLKNLSSEKNQAQLQIKDLQRQIKEMVSPYKIFKFYSHHK